MSDDALEVDQGAEVEGADVDTRSKDLLGSLGDLVVEHSASSAELTVRVDAVRWSEIAHSLKELHGFAYFSFLSAVDWLPNPELNGEKTYDRDRKAVDAQETIVDSTVRLAGGQARFGLMARVARVADNFAVTVTADVPDDLRMPSWTGVYRGANWHERETWEMFGIVFDGHPDLRHIYLPSEFEGFPLRKDYPLLARVVRPWPGLVDMEEMPAAEPDEEVTAE